MRVVHISDTHLGFSAYSKLDPAEGVNQREMDVYAAFEQAVDRILELRPDVVVHSGDLFDQVRPQNRAIDRAMRQLLRLSEAGIETVVISGNHSTPRLKETGSIFRVFEHLSGIHPLHEPGAKTLVHGDLTISAIPHSASSPLKSVVEAVKPSTATKYNVLTIHAGVTGPQTYRMDEFNEQTVPLETLSDGWDYVALGHYHEFRELRERVCYSGSTERLGFGELNQRKGFLEVDLERRGLRFHELKIRDMLELSPIDASGLVSTEILNEASRRIDDVSVDEKIVRLCINGVAPDAYRALDMAALRRLGSSTLHFEVRVDRPDEEGMRESGDTQIGVLADEFKKYIASLAFGDEKKARLLDRGIPYLTRGEDG